MLRRFILLFALGLSGSCALAAPLGTGFTYQGELQVSGAPANGQFDFEFALFDALNGGAELGTTIDVQNIVVVDGIFSVELDFGATPFAGDQLWIDIAVRNGTSTGGYTGLLPRQKLTATPYALHAEMVAANAISGAEIANNTVAAADIATNAVGQSEINSAQVQQRVTGTCASGSFATGVNQNGSLNCVAGANNYTDADAVAAILANDGTGSGLDADLLDGQNASQLTEASRIGTLINSVPLTINQPGRYYFASNLTYFGDGAAITINADDVIIDMNGFTLMGPFTVNTTDGIFVTSAVRDHLTVTDGTIRRFGGEGIQSSNSFSRGNRVERVRIVDVGGTGISFAGSGSIIADCLIENADQGIVVGAGLIRSTSVINSGGAGIRSIRPSVFTDIVIIDAGGTPITNQGNGITERTVIN